jgi:hypothetical protein
MLLFRKLLIVFLLFFHSVTLSADEYRWNLVNALIQRDFTTIENIIKANVDTMSAADKRLVINFALTYSHGDNTVSVFDILQKYNIHPNSFDLYTAINRNQPDNVIQFILRNGVRANGEILLLSMERQRFGLAREFIESGIDVNYQYPLTRSYADGMTALLYASKWGNFELVKLLVEYGANINARARDGNTAVSIARTNENAQIYNYLLENGANETGGAFSPPPQNADGIASILENQSSGFQTGTYRHFGSNTDIRFSGNGNYGSISYFMNGRAVSGSYRTEGGYITIIMEGRTLIYKIDSNMSFSRDGEVWIRTGN